MCRSLTSSANGSVTYTSAADGNGSYSFNVVARYSCNTGFSLVGNDARTCTGDGNSTTGDFDGVVPTCEGVLLLCLEQVSFFTLVIATKHT